MLEKHLDKKPEVAITSKNVKNKVVQKMAFLSLLKEVKSIKGKSCHRKNCKMENCVKEKHEWKTRNGKTGSGKTVSCPIVHTLGEKNVLALNHWPWSEGSASVKAGSAPGLEVSSCLWVVFSLCGFQKEALP